jgi:hypothetical protein
MQADGLGSKVQDVFANVVAGLMGCLRRGLVAVLLALPACAGQPPPGNDAYCASLFNQLDAFEFVPEPGGVGFDFRQMQLARIRQARCVTFSNDLAGLEAAAQALAPHALPGGPAFPTPVAVQAGVVTNGQDAARSLAFFAGLGYRARTVGWPELGTRVYVEARTPDQIADVIAIAERAGFIGPYPSRWVRF